MTFLQKRLRLLTASALATFAAGAAAQDIELFTVPPMGSSLTPNVLFVVDNSANWNANLGSTTKEVLEKEALTEVLVNDPAIQGKMRVGLMSFAHGNSPKGGKILAAVQDVTDAYQAELNGVINPTNTTTGPALVKSNNKPYGLAFNEMYRYFKGLSPMSGTQDTGTYDTDAVSGGLYVSPAEVNQCSKNFVVLIGNGEPDSGENNEAESKLTELGGRQTNDPIDISPDGFEANWSDEYARFMHNTDFASPEGQQNVITYVVDVFDPNANDAHTNKFKSARAWLNSIGTQGMGGYYAVSTKEELVEALRKIKVEIQSVNSVFASVTLPVSINVRGTNLNQVYMGVFRPDGTNKPLWRGNLKLYQMGRDPNTGEVYLADIDGERADSSATGFIRSTATSFWSHDSTFWQYAPQGDTATPWSDKPDGDVVEKGGVAQMLRENYTGRSLFTCVGSCLTGGSALSSTPFNSTHVSATDLGAADTTERDLIIDWMRGLENSVDENGDSALSGPRASIHGDVLHSRPAVVSYADENDIVIFYGGNDGVFRAVRGGPTGTQAGHELWGFVPQEHLGKLKMLRDNAVMEKVTDKPYFVDGSISVLRKSASDVMVFLSMRRGGEFLYALDVSDPTNPKFKWRRSSADWPELGQTWSEPQVAKINLNGVHTDVLIFGAGYDAAANDASAASAVASKGRGIMVVDARDGRLIWEVGPSPRVTGGKQRTDMSYSIPSDITVLNRDGDIDGLADRLYVGDTGGNVWRVDINDPNTANWTVHKLAALGGGQKFLYSPDVVYAKGYDAILIGSGDREHPFDTTVTNSFYMIKDAQTGANVVAEGSIPTLTKTDLHDATLDITTSSMTADDKGWFFNLRSGEKTVGSAITLAGTTYFATNQPSPPEGCLANLGIARIYTVSYENATTTKELQLSRSEEVPGGGLLPSPVPLIVEFQPEGVKDISVCFGPNCEDPPKTTLDRRVRSFWYRNEKD
jgi:type IV pilus assembly protein PilY1